VRAISVFFVGRKEFQGTQQKGPEPAPFRISAIEISPFEHADEEVLREILRLIRRMTAPAQKSIERIPVVRAKGNQGRPVPGQVELPRVDCC
jgi:hypothetical protein